MKKESHHSPQKTYFWHGITMKEKALFYEHLSNLIDGWVPLIQAIHSFLEKTNNPRLYNDVSSLLLFVESGDSVSTGMKKLPLAFDKREISIVEAWEQSGTLQLSFSSLAEELRSQSELVSKVKGALTYPLIIVFFLIGAVLVIMTYVVPKIQPLFDNSEVALPAATQALIATSEFVKNNFFLLCFLLIVGIFLFQAYARTYRGRQVLDRMYLRLPLIGSVYRNYLIVRVASTLGLLLWAGIPILKTLQLTGESANNLVFSEHLLAVSAQVKNGKKLASSFEEIDPEYRVFTQDFVQIIGAGERTSTVNKVCGKISTQYVREVDNSVSVLVRFVEPLAILVAGVFVLWFAFAIFSAVLKITETVG